VTRALLLTALFSSSAFGLPPRTLESLRNDLARDFPPASGTAYSVDPVAIGADGRVRVGHLKDSELAFLERVFKKMKFGTDRKIHMVTMSFSKPAVYTTHSFVEVDDQDRLRIIQEIRISIDSAGKVTTISPYFPPDSPPSP